MSSIFSKVLPLSYFKNVLDVDDLFMGDELTKDASSANPYNTLNKRVAEMVSDYSLVGFKLLSIKERNSLADIACIIDKSNGFIYNENYKRFSNKKEKENEKDVCGCEEDEDDDGFYFSKKSADDLDLDDDYDPDDEYVFYFLFYFFEGVCIIKKNIFL
jgi:hypothetical protein